jgi:hypothetical protein
MKILELIFLKITQILQLGKHFFKKSFDSLLENFRFNFTYFMKFKIISFDQLFFIMIFKNFDVDF